MFVCRRGGNVVFSDCYLLGVGCCGGVARVRGVAKCVHGGNTVVLEGDGCVEWDGMGYVVRDGVVELNIGVNEYVMGVGGVYSGVEGGSDTDSVLWVVLPVAMYLSGSVR